MTDDTELQSTAARVLAREPEPGGIGDLHADIAVLRSRLREAVHMLQPFADAWKNRTRCDNVPELVCNESYHNAAAFIAELERDGGK